LLTDRGVSSSDAPIAVSLMGAASLLGRLVTGWLLDRFFAPWLAFCLLALAALGIFILSGARSLAVKLSMLTLLAAVLMLGMPAYRAYAGRSMAAGVSG